MTHTITVGKRIAECREQGTAVYRSAGTLAKWSWKAFLPTQGKIIQVLQFRDIGLSDGVLMRLAQSEAIAKSRKEYEGNQFDDAKND